MALRGTVVVMTSSSEFIAGPSRAQRRAQSHAKAQVSKNEIARRQSKRADRQARMDENLVHDGRMWKRAVTNAQYDKTDIQSFSDLVPYIETWRSPRAKAKFEELVAREQKPRRRSAEKNGSG